MKVVLIQVGKTTMPPIAKLVAEYEKRLARYIKWQQVFIPDLKNAKKLTENQIKEQEGSLIVKELKAGDFAVLLDENGKQYSSEKWAQTLQKFMNAGPKRLIFIIGGPYGFSPEVYARAQAKVALSTMTFSHQIIRAIFMEQLYRGFSILNNDPYHHA
jgi:23S rRNA (pseudouridine1915-N3)-methyltransferase